MTSGIDLIEVESKRKSLPPPAATSPNSSSTVMTSTTTTAITTGWYSDQIVTHCMLHNDIQLVTYEENGDIFGSFLSLHRAQFAALIERGNIFLNFNYCKQF